MEDEAQPDPLVGQTLLEKLQVIRVVGGGGMGSVYEVEHLYTGHRRALKLIKPEYVRRRTFMKRLVREASVAGKLQTPYVVETYDAGVMEDGSAYVLMELLHGKLLIDLLDEEELLSVSRLVGIVVQICEGVSVAHGAGIIHRDLKPENVFLVNHPTGHERVKILDFGISKFKDQGDETSRLTAEGTILGTPFYMSPEQAAAKEVDERTDVYSVGVMLYEALTGRLPFDAKSVGALFIKIASGEHLPMRHFRPDVEPEFAAVVERAMARDRNSRYQTMEALRTALLPWAPSELRVRTKTISDSPRPGRGTADYQQGIPAAAATPGKGTLAGAAPAPDFADAADSGSRRLREERSGSQASRASSASSSAMARRLPWVLAAAAALALGMVLLLAGDDGDEAPSESPAEVSAAPAAPQARDDSEQSDPTSSPEPERQPEEEARAAESETNAEGEPTEEALAQEGPAPRPVRRTGSRSSPMRPDAPPTRAEEVGLETNPYGMR